jgi:host factor-I protein
MENPLNIQNTFFNQARKDRSKVTIYLTSGIKLLGRIKSFDKFTLILESNNGEQMIFKHAISTVSTQRAFGTYMQMDRNKTAEAVGASTEKEGEPAAEHATSASRPTDRPK